MDQQKVVDGQALCIHMLDEGTCEVFCQARDNLGAVLRTFIAVVIVQEPQMFFH